jgi:hypothetical protein
MVPGGRRERHWTDKRKDNKGIQSPHSTPHIIGKLLGQLGSLRPKISAQPQAAGSDS